MIKKLHTIILELLEAEELDLLADLCYMIEEHVTGYKEGKEDFDGLKFDILCNIELVEFLTDTDLKIKLLNYQIKKNNSKHNLYNKENIFNHDYFGKGDTVIKNLDKIYKKYDYEKIKLF